jgi:hypothetical protein
MPATFEDHMKSLGSTREVLEKQGITPERLAQKLNEELDAKENKVFYDKERGKCHVGPSMISWKIRQAARMDAQKLLGLYPAEKVEMDVRMELQNLDDDELRQRLNELDTEISKLTSSFGSEVQDPTGDSEESEET